jgi:hypothetical protein
LQMNNNQNGNLDSPSKDAQPSIEQCADASKIDGGMQAISGNNNTQSQSNGGNIVTINMTALAGSQSVIPDLLANPALSESRKANAFKAFGHLCASLMDVPSAYLEGIAAKKRAETEVQLKQISAEPSQIVTTLKVEPEYVRSAVSQYGLKIVREQMNLDKISEFAAQQIQHDNESPASQQNDNAAVSPILEDWLNNFEQEARQVNSEAMQILFGRILAGEIQRPSSFSIKTVKILRELDVRTANLFCQFCSLCISITFHDTHYTHCVDARVCSLGGGAGQNALQQYSFDFDNLNILHEHGLIISEYNSMFNYQMSIMNEHNVVGLPFSYQKQSYGLIALNGRPINEALNISGVSLSSAGKELSRIVDFEPSDAYTTALVTYFSTQNLQMCQISNP